jgi:predicted CopG family antitoxin
MPRKNINVSEIVHEKLSLEKRKEETFDEMLKRTHGIYPSGIDELVAFYPEGLADAVRELVSNIEEQAPLEKAIAEYDGYYALEFDHPESAHTVIQVQFREDPTEGMHALYCDHYGEFQTLVEANLAEEDVPDGPTDSYGMNGDSYPVFVGPDINGEYGVWEVELLIEKHLAPRLENKIAGSYERWG